MKHLKKAYILMMLLTVIMGSRTFAQDSVMVGSRTFALDFFNSDAKLKLAWAKQDRAKEVMQDNEYTSTGYETGLFLCNPLMLNGTPLNYGEFNLATEGELAVSKGTAIPGQTTQVPFYAYLRRDGKKVLIPGKERVDQKQVKIDLSEILQYAKPGDLLVIEAVNKEDGPVKRILKLLGGC